MNPSPIHRPSASRLRRARVAQCIALALCGLTFASCGLIRGVSVGIDLALPRLVVRDHCPPPDVVIIDRRPRRWSRRR